MEDRSYIIAGSQHLIVSLTTHNANTKSLSYSVIMATQSGIIIEAVNSPYTTVGNLPRSSPAAKEVLVKSLLVGINPV
jgi:hypothetical protein